MNELSSVPSLLGQALLDAIRQPVREELVAASGNTETPAQHRAGEVLTNLDSA